MPHPNLSEKPPLCQDGSSLAHWTDMWQAMASTLYPLPSPSTKQFRDPVLMISVTGELFPRSPTWGGIATVRPPRSNFQAQTLTPSHQLRLGAPASSRSGG